MMNNLLPSSSAVCRRVRAATILSLLTGGALASGLHRAAAQGSVAEEKTSGKEYVLTKASSFHAPLADARNPFWPVGWTPVPAVAAASVVPVYSVKVEDFVLSSTSVDYPPLAIINGKSYAVGDAVPVASGADAVRIKAIQDGVVLLDHHGRELRVATATGAARSRK